MENTKKSEMDLENEYENIRRYFKVTTEPYDYLDWGEETLLVFYKDKVIERYSREDLIDIGILES